MPMGRSAMNNETLENGFLDVAGHRIAYTRQGRGSAIALVHGIPTSRHLWRNVIPLLAASGHEVLAIDLLGYGDSDKPSDADLGIQAQSEIIFQALSALGWKRATIVGHDIGGGIAQLVAINHPEILDRLVLIDSILYDSFPEPGIARLKEPVWDEILGAANFDLKKGLAKAFHEACSIPIELPLNWLMPMSVRSMASTGGTHTCVQPGR